MTTRIVAGWLSPTTTSVGVPGSLSASAWSRPAAANWVASVSSTMSAWWATVASQTAWPPVTVSADAVADVEAGVATSLLDGADEVAGQALGRELGRHLGVEDDEAARRAASPSPGAARRRRVDDGLEGVLPLDQGQAAGRDGAVVATDQSPDLLPLMALLHVAAQPRTGRAGVDGEPLADAEVGLARLADVDAASTALTLSSSATIAPNGSRRAGSGDDDGELGKRQARRAARWPCAGGDAAEQTSRARSIAGDERVVVPAGRDASGQSVRCTERSAGQAAPDLLGDERQQRRRDPA